MFPGVPGDVFVCSEWIAAAGTAANGLWTPGNIAGTSWPKVKIKKKQRHSSGQGGGTAGTYFSKITLLELCEVF